MSTPQSIINICAGVRLDSRYQHTIYFDSADKQKEYFAEKVVRSFSAYSYLRKTWSIKVEADIADTQEWNYLYFRNPPFGKTYYYFINHIEYVNDNTVVLTLEMDLMQTYFFDFDLLPCYIDRQHTETDAIGEHTVEEGLELGEYTFKGRAEICKPNDVNMCILVMSTINPAAQTEETAVPALAYQYNRVFSGVKIWAVDSADWVAWGEQLEKLDEIGQTGAILGMWMYPKELVVLGGEDSWDNNELVHVVERAVTVQDQYFGANEGKDPTFLGIDHYYPKNNKLYTYPYNFLYVTNYQGAGAVYKYELFEENIAFLLSGSVSPDGGVRLTPFGYKNVNYNYTDGLTLTGYPSCAWDSDSYKIWLAQNQNSQQMNLGTNILKVGGGLATALLTAGTGVGAAAGLGMAASGALGIANQIAQKKDADIEPPQARGNFSTAVNFADGFHQFGVYYQCIRAEQARIIDDYFTMYGYKISRVQRPNMNARPAFTYVKTIGCKIKGELCNEDVVKMESIFDNGITFWRNGDKMCDYTQDNAV